MGAGELQAVTGAPEPFDGFPVEAVRGIVVAEQRTRAGLEPQSPVGVASARALREALEGALGEPMLSGPDGRLDELGHRPRRAQLVGGSTSTASRTAVRATS
jgi:hypothetical protein